jgi:hypothetical protein
MIPGRYAMPAVGWLLLAAALWTLAHVFGRESRAALGTSLLVAAVTAVVAWWVARYGTVRIPACRRASTNLEGVRGLPRVWLVAHLDTKSQPIPLLVRAAGVVTSLAGWGTLFAVWAVSGRFDVPDGVMVLAGGAAAIGAIPLALATIGERSEGALDNGSGVAAVLRAVELLPRDLAIGVLLTSAEELGLAGASAWATAQRPAIALNCDGVDDTGRVSVTVARDPDGAIRAAVREGVDGLRDLGPVVVRRAAPGVWLDAIAFANAGWGAATLSRGGLRSLARVHGEGDSRARLRGDGIEDAARLLCSVTRAMIGDGEMGTSRIASGEE